MLAPKHTVHNLLPAAGIILSFAHRKPRTKRCPVPFRRTCSFRLEDRRTRVFSVSQRTLVPESIPYCRSRARERQSDFREAPARFDENGGHRRCVTTAETNVPPGAWRRTQCGIPWPSARAHPCPERRRGVHGPPFLLVMSQPTIAWLSPLFPSLPRGGRAQVAVALCRE